MKHPTDEQFVAYHYGDAADRSALEEHLAACAECRTRYDGLKGVLAAVDAWPVPERGEGYGREVWARLQPRLEERRKPVWTELFRPRRWVFVAATVVLVMVAFLVGRYLPRPEVARQPASPQVRERILLVAVGEHLERSEIVLIELTNLEGNGRVDIAAEKAWAEELVGANRLYRQTAAQAGETGLASVLEDLERALLEIANSPSELSSLEFQELRRRIEAQGILFKVRVIGTEVRERERTVAQEGALGRT